MQAAQAHRGREAAAGVLTGDRRGAARVGTLRDAVFTTLSGVGLLRQGTACDISLTGLQIRAFQPLPVGASLEIELHPNPNDPASRTIVVRGRVARVAVLDDGEFALGIRLYVAPVKGSDRKPFPRLNASEAWGLMANVATQLRAADSAGRSLLALTERAPSHGDCPVTFARVSAGGRPGKRRRSAAALILLLLLFLLSSGGTGLITWVWSAHAGNPATAKRLVDFEGKPLGVVLPRVSEDPDVAASAGPLLSQAHEHLALGRIDEGLAVFSRLLAQGSDGPVERFAARLGYAEGLALQGNTPLALAAARSTLADVAGIPVPWISAARELQETLLRSGRGLVHVDLLRDALVIEPFVRPPDPVDLYVVVDKHDHVLTVYVEQRPIHAFAVGLGQNDATPEGHFQIANKIRYPDWYNRGERVKTGDPRNPLGAYWMGLGTGGRATSYGIHPTSESESIGRDMSRGCIRMRPADAEIVFDLCPVGTEVRICE